MSSDQWFYIHRSLFAFMKIGKTLYVTNRTAWRKWLSKNKNAKEIWLIYYRKASGKKRIPYDDAVEEALCYGWIDSIMKKIDEERFAQRFTPRKSRNISAMNKERVRRLIKQKKMTKRGLEVVDLASKYEIKKDIEKAMKAEGAWDNFNKFPLYYRKIRIGYLEAQRKHSETMFQKALNYLIKMTKQNKKFGMVK